MRTIALTKRILKELIRDTRTLLLVLVMPIIIMALLKFAFTANTNTNATVGLINTSSQIEKKLDDNQNISVKNYSSKQKAMDALRDNRIAGIIEYDQSQNKYKATYSNDNVEKTNIIKMGLQSVLIKENINHVKNKISTMSANLQKLAPVLAKQNPALAQQLTQTKHSHAEKQATLSSKYLYGNKNTSYFDTIIPTLLNVFVFLFVFLTSGMALLNERIQGTLDRMLATPIRRGEIVLGYFLSYGIVAVLQTLITVSFSIKILNVEIRGSVLLLMMVNLIVAFVALALGLLLSTLAESQFQMMQFIPLALVPQIFFCGIVPLDSMPKWIRWIGDIMPLQYSGTASKAIVIQGASLHQIMPQILILLAFVVVIAMLNIIGLKRYRKV